MQNQDPTTDTPQDQAPPVDPNAPTRHTLPSGKIVEVRSHRTLIGEDVDAVVCSQTATGARGVYDIYNALAARLVTELEPGAAGKPTLDGTVEAVKAQRADDYNRMHNLVREAFDLVNGRSVIPDLDTWQDEAGPTRDSNGSRSVSADERRS